MRKRLLLILCVLLACAIFIYVGGAIGGDSLTLTRGDENEKIVVGVFEPLTGYNSPGGNQELLGLQYAREKRPTVYIDETPYDIEFVITDNKSEEGAAVTAAEFLVSSEVCAVLGSYGCTVSRAGGAVFDSAGIPAIAISCTNPEAVSGYSNYHSVSFSDSFQGSVLANFTYGKGLRNAAVLTQAGDIYSKGLGRYFSDEFTRLGGELAEFSFNSAQTNFEELIKSVKASGIDCVFMPSSPSSAVPFINQAREAGLSVPIIGSDSWDTGLMLTELTSGGKQIYFSSPFTQDDSSNAAAGDFAGKFGSWVARSEDRLGQNGASSYAPAVAALACDAYMILCDAIEAANSCAPGEIARQLRTAGYTGITGEIVFGESAAAGKKPVYIKGLDSTGRKFELIQTYLAE